MLVKLNNIYINPDKIVSVDTTLEYTRMHDINGCSHTSKLPIETVVDILNGKKRTATKRT